jgi:hypothetical protein
MNLLRVLSRPLTRKGRRLGAGREGGGAGRCAGRRRAAAGGLRARPAACEAAAACTLLPPRVALPALLLPPPPGRRMGLAPPPCALTLLPAPHRMRSWNTFTNGAIASGVGSQARICGGSERRARVGRGLQAHGARAAAAAADARRCRLPAPPQPPGPRRLALSPRLAAHGCCRRPPPYAAPDAPHCPAARWSRASPSGRPRGCRRSRAARRRTAPRTACPHSG